MASGSTRTDIRGGTERVGPTKKIEALCSMLAKEFSQRTIRLITGATARDKVGYLIGKQMKESLVTTYTWLGAEREDHNEIEHMIRVVNAGRRPTAVIERLLSECNILIIVGGGALSLREAITAISQGIPVIPIAVGGQFASDVVHAFFTEQHKAMGALSADIGLDARFGAQVMELLTIERLKSLSLSSYSPEHVARTILDVLDHAALISGRIFVGKDE